MGRDVFIGCDPNLKAFYWAADYEGCGWYRCMQPSVELAKHYWRTACSTQMEEQHFVWDLIIAQRVCRPEPTQLFNAIATGGEPNLGKIVLELDDLLTAVPADYGMAGRFYNEPEIKANLINNMKVAAGVIVSTEPLADEYRKYNKNIFVVPNMLDSSAFRPKDTVNRPQIVIGWAGGPTHARDFSEARGALQQVMGANQNVVFKSVGWNPSQVLDIPVRRHFHEEWVNPTPNYYPLLDDFDIGIAPLLPSRFNDCKSELKAMEYGAKGIPVVASKFGPYERYIKHGETGFLAKKHSDWVKYLNILVNDPELRRGMGEAARQQAATRTVEGNWLLLDNTYKKVLGI